MRKKLLVDLYLPIGKQGPASYLVVIFIHGTVPSGVTGQRAILSRPKRETRGKQVAA